MVKILKDKSGHYLIGAIASIHPEEIKSDRRDQSQVTSVHTQIATLGGQTHHTAIPWDEASAAFDAFHAEEQKKEPPPA